MLYANLTHMEQIIDAPHAQLGQAWFVEAAAGMQQLPDRNKKLQQHHTID
jgi:hypothetical protein